MPAPERLPRTRLEEVFRDRRVLVTGHTGFKGSWLSLWLQELGARVCGYSLAPPTDPNLFRHLRLAERMGHRIGDVRDGEDFEAYLRETGPEVVFHLAAQSLVRVSYESPLETLDTNIMGTARVLDSLRRYGRPCTVIAVTSDKCYENRGGVFVYSESDCLGGHDPYSASKGAAEIVINSYRQAFFPPEGFAGHAVALASVRAGNVIGGGDWARDRIVPDIVRALYRGEPVQVRNPAAVRPWQHAFDALSGYLWLAARMLREGAAGLAEAWNFGPVEEEAVPVSELVDGILRAWQAGSWEHRQAQGAPPEARYLRLCCDKAVQRLGWRPTYRLQEAIQATAAWYLAARESGDMYPFSVEQLRQYSLRARQLERGWALTPNHSIRTDAP